MTEVRPTNTHLTEREYAAILKRAMNIGEMMLKSGSEVGRIEDTISRICRAYGAVRTDVLTITSSIIVTLETPEGDNITHTRRITSRDYDMMKIEALNRLSRTVCETRMPVEEIDRQLAQIDKIRHLPWFVTLFAFLISASSFCVFFGGTWRDAIAVLLPAAVIFGLEKLIGSWKVNKIVYYLFASCIAGAISVGVMHIGLGVEMDTIMIGAIMLLIPGMAITGAIEDLLIGDTISGLLRLCESLIAACAIAAGFAMATYLCGGNAFAGTLGIELDPVMSLAMAVPASVGFALKFGMKRPSRLIASALGGLLTWIAYLGVSHLGAEDFASCFIAAAVGGICSQLMARGLHAPSTVFLVPALIPLVPGRALYYTMSSILAAERERASYWASSTAVQALGIALGIVFVLVVLSAVRAVTRRANIHKNI